MLRLRRFTGQVVKQACIERPGTQPDHLAGPPFAAVGLHDSDVEPPDSEVDDAR